MGFNVAIIWKTYTEVGYLGFCRKQAQSGPKIYGIYCLIYPSGSVLWIQFPYAKHTESTGDATELCWEVVYFLNFEKVLWQHKITVDAVLPQQ